MVLPTFVMALPDGSGYHWVHIWRVLSCWTLLYVEQAPLYGIMMAGLVPEESLLFSWKVIDACAGHGPWYCWVSLLRGVADFCMVYAGKGGQIGFDTG